MFFPNTAVLSLFRDIDEKYVQKYVDRILSLDFPTSFLHIYAVEGDSKNKSYDIVKSVFDKSGLRYTLIKKDTGLPFVRKIITLERMDCLSQSANAGFEKIVEDDWANYVWILESDLEFDKTIVQKFLNNAYINGVLSGNVWMKFNGIDMFYDTWAYRFMNGKCFPHFNKKEYPIKNNYEVFSAGSSLFLSADLVYGGARYTKDEAIVGFCKECKKLGSKIFIIPSIDLYHP